MQSLPVVVLPLFAIIGLWGTASIAEVSHRVSAPRWQEGDFKEGLCKRVDCHHREGVIVNSRPVKCKNGVPKCVGDDGRETCDNMMGWYGVYPGEQPFCASDGNNYYSIGALSVASCKTNTVLKFKHHGKCHDSNESSSKAGLCKYAGCRCRLRNRVPKCVGNDGKDDCVMMLLRIGDVHENAFCASDGRTYYGMGELAQASCLADTTLAIKHKGKCSNSASSNSGGLCLYAGCKCRLRNGVPKCIDKDGTENCKTFDVYLDSPVCASDGKTYGTPGKLMAYSCDKDLPLTLVHKGKCRDSASFSGDQLDY